MKKLSRYYISRALISIALGGLVALTISPWWVGLLFGVFTMAFFLWAPHGGRYTVRPELGASALRLDERQRAIKDRSARNGFVAVMIVVAALAIYFGLIANADVPASLLSLVVGLGWAVYFVSDIRLRRN
jgi:hypothetical protein